jgi:transcriptional regulator with XRE-family HTH domain
MKDFDLAEDRELSKKIGRRIFSLRENKGMSLDELSFGIGISQQQLFEYESGQNKITVDCLVRIAEVLNLKMIHFFPIEDFGEKVGVPFLDGKDCEILEHLAQFRILSGEEMVDRFVKLVVEGG